MLSQERLFRSIVPIVPDPADTATIKSWFRRCRVTHLVAYRGTAEAPVGCGNAVVTPHSTRSSIIPRARRRPGPGRSSSWTTPFPEVRVAVRSRTIADRRVLIDRLSRSDERDTAWFLAENLVPGRPDAQSARLVAWDGSTATVEHDGPCDLVLARSFDPGWQARIDEGPPRPVLPVHGGFQAVRLDGSGVHRVTLHYRTPRLALWTAITIVAAILDAGLWATSIWVWLRNVRRSPR